MTALKNITGTSGECEDVFMRKRTHKNGKAWCFSLIVEVSKILQMYEFNVLCRNAATR